MQAKIPASFWQEMKERGLIGSASHRAGYGILRQMSEE